MSDLLTTNLAIGATAGMSAAHEVLQQHGSQGHPNADVILDRLVHRLADKPDPRTYLPDHGRRGPSPQQLIPPLDIATLLGSLDCSCQIGQETQLLHISKRPSDSWKGYLWMTRNEAVSLFSRCMVTD